MEKRCFMHFIYLIAITLLSGVVQQAQSHENEVDSTTWVIKDLFSDVITTSHFTNQAQEQHHIHKRQTFYEGSGPPCEQLFCDAVSETCSEGPLECQCKDGFSSFEVGIPCSDIDECNIVGKCGANTNCENTIGSFLCNCNEGYQLNGDVCVDVDECLSPSSCDSNAACTNTEGSFTCACNEGYSGDGVTCNDVDECVLTPYPCDENANCQNDPGSYSCSCRNDFIRDGTTCTACRGVRPPAFISADVTDSNHNISILLRDLSTYQNGVKLQILKMSGKFVAEYTFASNADDQVTLRIPGATSNTPYLFQLKEDLDECTTYNSPEVFRTETPITFVLVRIILVFNPSYYNLQSSESKQLIAILTSSRASGVNFFIEGFLPGSVKAILGVANDTQQVDSGVQVTAVEDVINISNTSLNVSSEVATVLAPYPAPTGVSVITISDSSLMVQWDLYHNSTSCAITDINDNNTKHTVVDASDITFNDLTSATVYSYDLKCIVESVDGTRFTKSIVVFGFTAPSGTTNLKLEPAGADSITVSFDSIGDGNYQLTVYNNITNEKVSTNSYDNLNEISSTTLLITTNQLTANTAYRICVTNGIKLNNQTVFTSPVCSAATTGPTTPVLEVTNNTQAGTVISWKSDVNVVLYEYRAVNSAGVTIEGTTNETFAAFNTNRFVLGSDYNYYVTAVNSMGSKSKEATLNQMAASEKSFNFEVTLPNTYTYTPALANKLSTEFANLKSEVEIAFNDGITNLNTTATVAKFREGSVIAGVVVKTTSPSTTEENIKTTIQSLPISQSVESGFNKCLDNPCSSNGVCTQIGDLKHSCACKLGYTGDGVACSDINECDDTETCVANADCKNNAGSFTCVCSTGYSGNGSSECSNINECNGTNNCHTNADCADTPGSYTCACRPGYSGDGKSCDDINECDLRKPCAEHASCVNNDGGYVCTCDEGYGGDAEVNCIDINECSSTNACIGANKKCTNTAGSFTCSCLEGYNGGDNDADCVDIDECSANLCDDMAICLNTIGSFTCTCQTGYEGSGVGTGMCTDIDECKNNNQCSGLSTCVNTDGSFQCNCQTNYIISGTTCILAPQRLEINVNAAYESALQQNTNSKYLLLALKMTENLDVKFAGFEHGEYSFHEIPTNSPNVAFRFTATTSDENVRFETFLDMFDQTKGDQDIFLTTPTTVLNTCVLPNGCLEKSTCVFETSAECVCDYGYSGSECSDVNECATSNNCDENALCTNTIGSYTCTCNDGFFGSGFVCGGVECSPGQCSDFAECKEISGGGTECECVTGYEGNGNTCNDINECQDVTTFTCGSNEVCENTPGSYTCECVAGYTQSSLTSSCDEINECLAKPCPDNAECTDKINDYECTCNIGYEGDNCININECAGTNICNSNAVCADTDGSYECTCKAGFAGDGESCMEMNECESNPCDAASSDCVDQINSYACECKSGYEEKDGGCVNIDECSFGTCDRPYICYDLPGSHECLCPWGYEIIKVDDSDVEECVDVNECSGNICTDDATCTNVAGTYICDCNTGFKGNETVGCTDINECDTESCVENSLCANIPGSYTCNCVSGYEKNGEDCVDKNECDTNPCAANAQCENIAGSYNCDCLNGFLGDGFVECSETVLVQATLNSSFVFTDVLNDPTSEEFINLKQIVENQIKHSLGAVFINVIKFSQGSVIADVEIVPPATGTTAEEVKDLLINDEDASVLFANVTNEINACLGNPCSSNANCVAVNNAPSCTCREGYNGDGTTCTVVDQCLSNPCEDNEVCTQTDFSYTCACNSGFTNHSGDGCVDQCSRDVGYCLNGATCEQTLGTGNPVCKCTSNFSGERCDLTSLTWRLTVAFGVLAGVFLLVSLVAIIVYCVRRKRRRGDFFNA